VLSVRDDPRYTAGMSTVHYLQIEPTTRCNFTCGFCCGRHMPQEDLSYDTFERALEALPDLAHVELQGEGESFLHPRFFDMLQTLKDRHVEVSFITNGSLITPSKVDRLLDMDVAKISVSIESPDPEQFRAIRGGKLDKVVRNLENLLARRAERGLQRPVVGLSVTVLRSTRSQIGEILALYERLGLDGGISLQALQPMGGYAQHYDDTMEAEALDEADAERVTMAPFEDRDVRRLLASRAPVDGFYEQLMADWRPASRRCPYLEAGLYVHRTGEVTPCCMIKDTKAHGLGTIGETPTAELVANREVLRRQLAAGEVPDPCHGCFIAEQAVKSHNQLLAIGVKGLARRWFGTTLARSLG